MAPTLIGWVVFAADLDAREMRGLERLSAIPLHAAVLAQRKGRWTEASGSMSALDPRAAALAAGASSASRAAFEMRVGGDRSIALAKPLPTFSDGERAILLLAYPKAEAMADARKLQLALGAHDAARPAAGRPWRPGRRRRASPSRSPGSTRPPGGWRRASMSRSACAASDELARLANSFNEMVGKIAEREQRITQLAFNDVLTGLPNRTMFQQQLEHHFRAADGSGSLFALHCLDLDQFKVINDTLGHPAGDALLVEAGAARAGRRARPFRRAARRRRVRRAADRRRRPRRDRPARARHPRRDRPADHASTATSSSPSTSIGIAIAPQDGEDGGTLLRNADLALYRAKEAGRGTYAFFEESLNERAQQRRQLETDLRLALERGEFELLYQPLFDLEQNRICSFEALLRWHHPTRGLISPAEFMPVAEDTGLIVPIGAWVIREACAQAAHWPEHVRVAVNVSAVQFHRGALHETHPARARRQRPRARTGSRSRSPNRSSSKAARRRCACCTRCAASACASRSTISAPAIRRSAICRASRSTS